MIRNFVARLSNFKRKKITTVEKRLNVLAVIKNDKTAQLRIGLLRTCVLSLLIAFGVIGTSLRGQ